MKVKAALQMKSRGVLSIRDVELEEPALEVYDDDVTKALPQVTEWLKGLTEVSGQ